MFKRGFAWPTEGIQMFFIVPMIGDAKTPLYVTCDLRDANDTADKMNDAIDDFFGDMFTVECLFTMSGKINYSVYRDADNLDWVVE